MVDRFFFFLSTFGFKFWTTEDTRFFIPQNQLLLFCTDSLIRKLSQWRSEEFTWLTAWSMVCMVVAVTRVRARLTKWGSQPSEQRAFRPQEWCAQKPPSWLSLVWGPDSACGSWAGVSWAADDTPLLYLQRDPKSCDHREQKLSFHIQPKPLNESIQGIFIAFFFFQRAWKPFLSPFESWVLNFPHGW